MCAANNSNSDISFDFGFTTIAEDELDVTKQVDVAERAAAHHEDKLNRLYQSILPLLQNLKKNPEKEYIKWPNRVQKIEEFESKISKIVNQ
jgi:hypothetical protein